MLGTIVIISTALVPQMGGGNREKADVIQTMLFVAGLNTLLQTLFGTRLPAVIGSSYTYVPVAISIILSGRWNDPNPIERFKKTMPAIQGALIIASTIQIILGFSGLWRNAARMLSPLLAVPLVALAGFGLYEFGFPGVARCVEIGLPQLIILVLLSQQDKDMESKDLLEEETWIRMECILCILDVEHHKSMDLRQRSRIRWASLVCMIDKACEVATIADAVYGVWAKYRLQVTGRPPLEEVLEARKKKDEICNDSKSCRM